MTMEIKAFTTADWQSVWAMVKPVFRAGETYPYAPDISEEEAYGKWVSLPAATYVVSDDEGQFLGTYYIKPNQPSLGAHVCNCGYIVASAARGRGVASLMCEHSQATARALGFRAMQFNLVVSTNEVAVRLWKKLGFETIGTLPGAFNHAQLGFVDAFVMYKQL